MGLFGIVIAGFVGALQVIIFSRGKAIRQGAALELASDKLERILTIDPVTLDDSDDQTEILKKGKLEFKRVTDITVNSDQSITAKVTVSSTTFNMPSTVSVDKTFPLWGMQ